MPHTPRGVGMNTSKKKKQVPVEPLQEPPNPMCPCEPAAPQVETFEERCLRATRSMSPEKSRVVRLCIESDVRDKWCASIIECKQQCYRQGKALKRTMRARVQSSEFILVKNDKLTRKALMEPLPANDGTQPLPTQTYECTCATNPGVLQVRRLPSRPKDRQAHV